MEVSWDKIKEQYMENINKEVANIYYRGLQAGEEHVRHLNSLTVKKEISVSE